MHLEVNCKSICYCQKNGGDVLGDFSSEQDAEYAVRLLDERFYMKYSTKNCDLPLDTFSSVFVYKAIECSRNSSTALPDLNKFRLTPSRYDEFDANQILFQKKKWSDLVPLAKPPSSIATARKMIADYEADSPSLEVYYDLKMTEKNLLVETIDVSVDAAHASEMVQQKQKSSVRNKRKRSSSDLSMKSNGTSGKILEDDELDSNSKRKTKSPTSVQLKEKPGIERSTDNSPSQQEAANELPESIQSNDQPSPSRIHRSQSLPSPETGCEDDLLANDKESAEEPPNLTEPRSDRTDQAVLVQLNRTMTPRKDLRIAEEADGESSDSIESNDSRPNQSTPVKLVPNPVLGVTPPHVKRPKLVQRVFAGPASAKSGSKQKSPSKSTTRGKHDGWLSDDEDSLSGNENNNDSSEYSLSEGESNMFKRPKLVPRAFAGPPSAKLKKSAQKSRVPRSANSIAKAQVGFNDDDGFVSTDVSCNDLDDDNMSVTSSSSTTRKGPKLPFSRAEGQKILTLICDKKAFMYTKGNRLWQQMEESGVCNSYSKYCISIMNYLR